MSTREISVTQVRAEWQRLAQLYPFYAALNEHCNLGSGLCDELEQENSDPTVQQLESVREWFGAIDSRVNAFNIRELLHSSSPLSEDKLRFLLLRHLYQVEKTQLLREKLDFLLVQYFAQTSDPKVHPEQISFRDVADALRPVLGEVKPQKFAWSYELEKLSAEMLGYSSLKDLLVKVLLERGRASKRSIGDEYFQPSALIAITKFNFALRAGFFRLMHNDIDAITRALQNLRNAGVEQIDVSQAELSSSEPLDSIHAVCQEWKRRLRSDYQLGNFFKQLVVIREACERMLATPPAPQGTSSNLRGERAASHINDGPTVGFTSREIAPSGKAIDAASSYSGERPTTPEIPSKAMPREQRVPPVVSPKPSPQPPSPPPSKSASVPDPSRVQPANGTQLVPALGIDQCLERIAEQLLKKKGTGPSQLTLGDTKLVLATWEVEAFVRGGDEASDLLQRIVAARSLLAVALDALKKKEPFDYRGSLLVSRMEAARAEEEVRRAKERKDLDAAVNLAASGKRLQALIAEAEGLVK